MKTLKLTEHFKHARENDPMLKDCKNWIDCNYFAICEREIIADVLQETLYTCTKEGTVDMPDALADKYIAINWLEEVV